MSRSIQSTIRRHGAHNILRVVFGWFNGMPLRRCDVLLLVFAYNTVMQCLVHARVVPSSNNACVVSLLYGTSG